MVDRIEAEIPSKHWRGWEFWRVTTQGGENPITVARDWSLIDVWLHSYNLELASLLASL